MKKKFYSYYFILIAIPLIAIDASQLELLEKILTYKGKKTFLLSYPRSGNTWMRYCLEYLTVRPSIHRRYLGDDPTIGWLVGFEIDCTKPPIDKVHKKEEIDQFLCDYEHDLLILMVRNPKEAINRHERETITLTLLANESGRYYPNTYFKNIALYDSWKPENRLLIYYEDLVAKPAETLKKVLLFLQEPLDRLDYFMKEYALHKQKGIEVYKKMFSANSDTKGNDLLFHSRLMSVDHRKQIDEWIAQLHPYIWQTYLKDRYAEENLTY